jgi:hypothetical protein
MEEVACLLCGFMARDHPGLVHHPHCPNRPAPAAPRPALGSDSGPEGDLRGPATGAAGVESPDVTRCREYYAEMVADKIPRWGRFDRWWVGVLLAEIDRLRGEVAG